ncbi:hypothetical protein N566_21270 [Streptomycetaceae bacterium MP113-05]|nr:hypothetical protein N566_21270 [Streptomycetaceae bacterium MP113-05]
MRRIEGWRPGVAGLGPEYVWYAAYGSNLHHTRLGFYLRGGKPTGGRRTYPGCREPRDPVRTEPIMLPGQVYFALESPAWTGGMAFYDPDACGVTPARAYLISARQFSDIAAQEMHRPPGADLDLTAVLGEGRAEMGRGCYETLVCPGSLDGCPVLTFTAPWGMDEVPGNAPGAAYLRWLATGLQVSHAWSTARIAVHLAHLPGAALRWTAAEIATLL